MMIQTANSAVVMMIDFIPKPNRTIRTGTRAVSGALRKMFTQGSSSSSIEWVTTRNVLFSPATRPSRSSWNLRRVCSSTAENGSSISSTSLSTASARARPTRWRIPPDSSWGKLFSNPPRPTLRMYFSAIASRSDTPTPRSSSPKATLRSTLAQGRSAKSWNTKARSGPGPVTGRPFTSTSPAVGSSSPAMIFRSVVLPHPEGPSREVSCPCGNSSVRFLSASTSP